jgi:hypothetical protein
VAVSKPSAPGLARIARVERLNVIAQWVPISSLNLDLEPSLFLSQEAVRRYAAAMRRGERFPAINVVSDAGRLFVYDGFHRVAAARACGRVVIDTYVSPGSASDTARRLIRRGKAEGCDPAWIEYLELRRLRECAQ